MILNANTALSKGLLKVSPSLVSGIAAKATDIASLESDAKLSLFSFKCQGLAACSLFLCWPAMPTLQAASSLDMRNIHLTSRHFDLF